MKELHRTAINRHVREAALVIFLVLRFAPLCSATSTLTLSPTNPRQLSNSALQFTASHNGKIVDGPVSWTSSNPAVATITGTSSTATANLLSMGTTTITATHGGQRGSTSLTVTVAVTPVFTVQPTNTNVSAIINPSGGVKVRLLDNLGDPLPGQNVTISIGINPPGSGTLTGTLTQSTGNTGTAIFPNLKIDWLGTGYTLVASARPSSGAVSGTSAEFDELRVGDVCLGPDTPACQGTCGDADGDGLNDAWEIAGGVDINGDGLITDSVHDVLLPGANPNTPDIYVHYDWMDYGGLDYQCTADSDCPQNGNSQFGTATCTGPPVPGSAKSCVQSCQANSDCQALGEAHGSDRCIANVCRHTHDPEALTAGALDAVASRFASHGINLHIERGQAVPHSHVVSFRLLNDPQDQSNEMTDQCEGGSVFSGTAGAGKYAESYYDLKSTYFDPKMVSAYHYIIFGHYSGCDTADHCANDGHTGACPRTMNGGATVAYGQGGYSKINGDDFIVSLGSFINDKEAPLTDPAPGGSPLGHFIIGGTFMHELGHNLGLRHGGGVSATNDPNTCYPPDCEDENTVPAEPNFKPNYLSVMNYRYQLGGVENASVPGGFLPVDTRLDYSTQVLPTVPISDGMSGVLDEASLDESQPYGFASGTSDLFSYSDGRCVTHSAWPTHGPVDWDGSGVAGDNSEAVADFDPQSDGGACGQPTDKHRGHVDWGPAPGQSIFRYGFQCAPSSDNPRGVSPAELNADDARRVHVLYSAATVNIVIHPGCKSEAKLVAPGEAGPVTIALMGADDLNVSQVDVSSLRFHGARPMSTSVTDVDKDGKSDLFVTFNMADVKLDPKAKTARLTGWLKNSRVFVGEAQIHVVTSPVKEDPSCR